MSGGGSNLSCRRRFCRECRQRAPHRLSAGQKRRAALAGVLAMDPEALLLDEPRDVLDPQAKRALVATLRKLPQAKILVTHDVGPSREPGLARAVFFELGPHRRRGLRKSRGGAVFVGADGAGRRNETARRFVLICIGMRLARYCSLPAARFARRFP